MAFDGRNGSILWHVSGWDQVVGSPIFLKIDEDPVPDIILGGRRGQLYALSGANGEIIWQFFERSDLDEVIERDSNLSNFYTPQLIPDQNGDGLADILVAHGGDAKIAAYDPDRPVGQLLVVSSSDGQVLARMDSPDGAETYMTALCADLDGNGDFTVLFGTGGETFFGGFFRMPLADIMDGNLSRLKKLAASPRRGFIAPPVLADINGDGTLDIVTNAVEGIMMAFDGRNDSLLWKVEVPGTEVYGSIAVANFTGDATPDFFTNFGVGIFPEVSMTIQLLVDGQTGQIAFRDTLGYLQIGSPLAIDLDGDGYDEALITVNLVHESMSGNLYKSMFGKSNALIAFNFQSGRTFTLLGPFKGINAAATPWIGDLDGDNLLDLAYSYMIDTVQYLPFNGMRMLRQEFDIPVNDRIKWGSYMGNAYDGRAMSIVSGESIMHNHQK